MGYPYFWKHPYRYIDPLQLPLLKNYKYSGVNWQFPLEGLPWHDGITNPKPNESSPRTLPARFGSTAAAMSRVGEPGNPGRNIGKGVFFTVDVRYMYTQHTFPKPNGSRFVHRPSPNPQFSRVNSMLALQSVMGLEFICFIEPSGPIHFMSRPWPLKKVTRSVVGGRLRGWICLTLGLGFVLFSGDVASRF